MAHSGPGDRENIPISETEVEEDYREGVGKKWARDVCQVGVQEGGCR